MPIGAKQNKLPCYVKVAFQEKCTPESIATKRRKKQMAVTGLSRAPIGAMATLDA